MYFCAGTGHTAVLKMTSLKQNFITLLGEMQTFLEQTLKTVKLGKKEAGHRDQLLERVRQMNEELSPGISVSRQSSVLSMNSVSSSSSYPDAALGPGEGSDGSFTSAQNDDQGTNDGVPKVAVSSLRNIFQRGLLDKKKKSAMRNWESYYCVVSGNMFYFYKKATDPKQKGAFCLTGYEFQEAPGLDSSRKDMCFELTKPGSLPHQFRAACKDGMIEWKQSIDKGIGFVTNNGAYENADLETPRRGSRSGQSLPPVPRPGSQTQDDQEIYDTVGNPTDPNYYTDCQSYEKPLRATADDLYENQKEDYENLGQRRTVYDAMGTAPPLPTGKAAESKSTGRPKSLVRSPGLPQWPPVNPPDDDESDKQPAQSPGQQAKDNGHPPPLPGDRPQSKSRSSSITFKR